jgi:hypothetical protein
MNRSQRRLQKQVQKHMEEEQKKQQEKAKQEYARIMRLVIAVQEAGNEWTVTMSAKDKQKVETIIRQQEEDAQEWYDEQEDEDEEDDHDYCRNCGCHGTSFHGCCSVRCAKDADEYY